MAYPEECSKCEFFEEMLRKKHEDIDWVEKQAFFKGSIIGLITSGVFFLVLTIIACIIPIVKILSLLQQT